MSNKHRLTTQESHALWRLRQVLRQPNVDTTLYRQVLGCLPILLDLQDHGVQTRTAHVSPTEVTVTIEAPPAGVIKEWGYLSPPRGMPRAPVTCRAIVGHAHGTPVAVEWQAMPRFSERRGVAG